MKVLLSGASGFVGLEVLNQLLAVGHTVRVLARDPTQGEALRGKEGVDIFHGNILYAPTLVGCMEGVEAVIHLAGIICEIGENTFDRVHRVGTQNLLAEVKKSRGIKRFIHMSALGTRPGARSLYHQSKWAGEEVVRASGLDWTIFRPSIIYGPGDQFVNLFAKMTKPPLNFFQLFTLPIIDGGYACLQPIPITDVARCFVGTLIKPESIKKTYDLCGPKPLRLREVVKTIAEVLGNETKIVEPPLKRWLGDWSNLFLPLCVLKGLLIQPKILLIPVPMEVATVMAWLMEIFMTKPLLNRDQLLMLEEDNVGDPSEAMKDFGIQPPDFREGIAAYLKNQDVLPSSVD